MKAFTRTAITGIDVPVFVEKGATFLQHPLQWRGFASTSDAGP
jgi:hypothetical protein